MHDALGDALAIEVADLLEELVVLEGGGAAVANGALVLVIRDGVALAVGEGAAVVSHGVSLVVAESSCAARAYRLGLGGCGPCLPAVRGRAITGRRHAPAGSVRQTSTYQPPCSTFDLRWTRGRPTSDHLIL